MSIFPTRILLATDGSREATSASLDRSRPGPEHRLGAARHLRLGGRKPLRQDVQMAGDEPVNPRLDAELRRQYERQARAVLDAELGRVRQAGRWRRLT
jgi:hypothetical protein